METLTLPFPAETQEIVQGRANGDAALDIYEGVDSARLQDQYSTAIGPHHDDEAGQEDIVVILPPITSHRRLLPQKSILKPPSTMNTAWSPFQITNQGCDNATHEKIGGLPLARQSRLDSNSRKRSRSEIENAQDELEVHDLLFEHLHEDFTPPPHRQQLNPALHPSLPELTRYEKLGINELTFYNTATNTTIDVIRDVDPSSRQLYGRPLLYTAGEINENRRSNCSSIRFSPDPTELEELRSARLWSSLSVREQRSITHLPPSKLEAVFVGWHKRRSPAICLLKREVERYLADGIDLAETAIQLEIMGFTLARYRRNLNGLDTYTAELFGVHMHLMNSQEHIDRLDEIEGVIQQPLGSGVAENTASPKQLPSFGEHQIGPGGFQEELVHPFIRSCGQKSFDERQIRGGDPNNASLPIRANQDLPTLPNPNLPTPVRSFGVGNIENVAFNPQLLNLATTASSGLIGAHLPADKTSPTDTPTITEMNLATNTCVPSAPSVPSLTFSPERGSKRHTHRNTRQSCRRDNASKSPVEGCTTQQKPLGMRTRSQAKLLVEEQHHPEVQPSEMDLSICSPALRTLRSRKERGQC